MKQAEFEKRVETLMENLFSEYNDYDKLDFLDDIKILLKQL